MSVSSDWKSALMSIIEELSELEFEKMLLILDKIPKSKKNPKFRVQMAQIIIEHYGEEESISEIRRVMDLIPRRDSPVQNLLRPFVDKLKTKLGNDGTEILRISEDGWRESMTNMFKELEVAQYKKMLGVLEGHGLIRPKRITARFKDELPQRIMETLGLEESICVINTAMAEIPRNDPAVQNLLRPFVDKLETRLGKDETGMSSICQSDWEETLPKIIGKLEDAQYKQMLGILKKFNFPVPQRKTVRFKKDLPKQMIEWFGVKESIFKIETAMKEIPRNDAAIQDLLRPHVDKLKNKQRKKKEILGISEDGWREAMTNMFRELEVAQYKKMLGVLEGHGLIRPKRITARFKDELPQRIMETLGLEESICVINTAMAEIPRNDPAVQNLLRPFVDKLETRLGKDETGMSSICQSDWEETLPKIIGKLEDAQYKQMLGILKKLNFPVPQRKTVRFKKDLPKQMIEWFGVKESIFKIETAMKEIPRNDAAIQNLLRPHVDKLQNKQRKKKAPQKFKKKSIKKHKRFRRELSNKTDKSKKEKPRNDADLQDLLRPHVDTRRNNKRKKTDEILRISEDGWRESMTNMFRELEVAQYKKMLGVLEGHGLIRPKRITARFKDGLPQRIMETLGLEESICVINTAMAEIPRNDPAVQNLLRPFVDKLETRLGKDETVFEGMKMNRL